MIPDNPNCPTQFGNNIQSFQILSKEAQKQMQAALLI